MPQLSEIQGKLDIDRFICSLTLNQALEEIKQYKEDGDETAVAVLQAMVDALIDSFEPIEE